MNVEKFDIQKGKSILIIVVVIAIVVLIFVFGKNIMEFINQLFGKDDPQQADARKRLVDFNYQSSNPTSPFSPKVYKNRPTSTKVMSEKDARDVISEIASSSGFFGFGIDAQQGFAAIQKCDTQCDVSFCVTLYQSSFQGDMYDFMTRTYSSGENIVVMNQILEYVKALPVY